MNVAADWADAQPVLRIPAATPLMVSSIAPLQLRVDRRPSPRPDPGEQVDLQVGDRRRGRPRGPRRVRLSSGWSSSSLGLAGDAQHLGDGQLVLGPDHARTACRRLGRHQRLARTARRSSRSVLASVISTLEMKVRKKCHSACISASTSPARPPGRRAGRSRRRTSRARSAGTGSSRTPRGWRAGRRSRRRSRAAGPAGSRCSATELLDRRGRPGSRRAGRGRRSARGRRRTPRR